MGVLDSSKVWHRMRGHKISTPEWKEPGPDASPAEVQAAIQTAFTVIDQCSCGDRWVFNALAFAESYVPAERA